ncbi:hypothetical protein Leryth_006388 [Lithospermum erythrorhizon]|nr:hypothetical protein Leryth_006388 [Lithospermum erythrorhizon]
MGNLPVIIIPAICAEKNSPFGDSSTCTKNGMAYVSLSMAMGAIFVWSYAFNIIRAYGTEDKSNKNGNFTISKLDNGSELLLSTSPNVGDTEKTTRHGSEDEASVFDVIKLRLKALESKINLKILLRPPTIASIVGILIGVISPLRKVTVGDNAPLRVIESSVLLLGDAAIPSMTLIMGANLLKGLKRSGASLSVLVGMLIVRFIILPLCGVAVIKFAQNYGLVGSDPLYHFVLLLQYAVPPAMAIGTITQLFEIGETECSVFMFWNYAVAGIALTLWSTYFMWILS